MQQQQQLIATAPIGKATILYQYGLLLTHGRQDMAHVSEQRQGIAATVLGGIVMVLFFSGCQASIEPNQTQSPQQTASTSPSVSLSQASGEGQKVFASSKMDAPADFPLVPYWDAVRRADELTDSAFSDEEIAHWWNGREDALASCMKAKGFLYFPRGYFRDVAPYNDPLGSDYFSRRDFMEIPRLPETRAEAAAVGYGVQQKKAGEVPEEIDQNQEYIDSLSAKEKSAYQIAWVGVDRTAPDYDPYNQPEELGGCAGKVERDYPDPSDANADRNVRELHGDVITAMFAVAKHGELFENKQVIALNRKWRSCMVDKGYELYEFGSEGSFWDGPLQAYAKAIRTDRSGNIPKDETGELPDEQNRLVGLESERKIALLDFDCCVETNYLEVFTKTQRKFEQDFVDRNRKALEAMRAFVDGLT